VLIDMHSHLLPAVDDGSRSVEESVAMARTLVAAGFGCMTCTSHFWENLVAVTVDRIPRMVAKLQVSLDESGVDLKLVSGAEVGLRAGLQKLPLKSIPSYNMAGRYYLVDTWESTFPRWLFDSIRHLQSDGGKVIFAHPERNDALLDDPFAIDQLAEAGCLFQLNYYTLADERPSDRRLLAERYLAEGRYALAASDLHQPAGLPERLRGLERLKALLTASGKANLFDEYLMTTPRRILSESGLPVSDLAR
jgi:protein-tyrosine phosphatase